jgi:hypothetical protein
MWIGSDGARIWRYLVGVSSHRAFHVTGMGVSLPLCRQSLRVIPNTHLPQQYLLGNNPPFHRTLTAANFGLVDRVWTFAIVSIFSPQIEPP